jgi:hypothetical protein
MRAIAEFVLAATTRGEPENFVHQNEIMPCADDKQQFNAGCRRTDAP